ncbi:MAG: hypothetical protein JWP58_1420 [Hymenobacter sp.]|nr:hypothetical protein [Hymenobacter sp.]
MKSFSSFFSVGLLVLFLLAMRLPAAAQAPVWQSARAVATATAAATNTYSTVSATAVDAAGNVLLAGAFINTVVLGSTTLTSLGGYDVFVAKFNPTTNQFVWAQGAGGTGDELAYALAVSGPNVYVAGSFTGATAVFGAATLANSGNTGSSDVFVAKLTDAGTTSGFAWAQQAGGIGGNDQARALAVSGTSVYVAGSFTGPAMGLGSITLTNTSAGFADAFVAKLTDTGSTSSFAWAQQAGGPGFDGAAALAVSGTKVYMAGFTSSTASFGATTLVSVGAYDVFVAKLADAGSTSSFAWVQRAGGPGDEFAYALAVSGPSVYVAGSFAGSTAGFGAATLTNSDNAGSSDVFVAKLTDAGSTGSFAWARGAGGGANDQARALAASGTSVYVAGSFNSPTANFGATTLTAAGANGTSDVFVAKIADAGNTGDFAWAHRAGGIYDDGATALAVSGTSIHVVGGVRSPTAGFGALTFSNPNTTYLGFLATLTDPTLTATAPSRALAQAAQLFPNPAHGTATLRLPAGTAPAPLTLADALGRSVRRYPAPTGPEATLDLHGLPAGLYLLRGAGSAQRLAVE